jgi:hypothetical protein
MKNKNLKKVPPLDQKYVSLYNVEAYNTPEETKENKKIGRAIYERIEYVIRCLGGRIIDDKKGWSIAPQDLKWLIANYPADFGCFDGVKWSNKACERFGEHVQGEWIWERFPYERSK